MANNPLQRTGLLKVSDIMKEKEWLGTENKSLTNLVEGNDRLAPYVVLNTLNPLNIRTRITTKPYRISSWYDYNHALTEGSTELNGTIVGGTMKAMTKGSSESGPGLGLYNNHLKTLTNHLLNCTAGNAAAKSAGNDTYLDVWTRFEVTNAVTGGRGNYYVDNSRAYLQIDLSSISSMRVISKAEILLTCVTNTYTPCRVVLVKYEGGTNFVDYSFYPYSQVISDPVLFASGEQTFSLNSAGVAYLNEKFVNGDKYLRVGLITYDYDFLQQPFIGDNLVQGADSTFTAQGHWQLNNNQTAGFTTELVGTRTLPVMKVFPGTSERISLILAGSNYSPVISGGTYYFLNWYYRFGQYPVNFDKSDFGGYTMSYISGNELPLTFLHPDNPTGMSPEWQNGYAFTSVAAGGDLLINVGGPSYAEDSVNELAVADLKIVNPIFSKTLGGRYNTPKLRYYYDGYSGGITTGSVSGLNTTQATIGGTVTTDGRTVILSSGICWNTTGTPTIANSKTTDGGTSVASFTSTATGLSMNTTYYVRPYVTTEVGTYYGSQTSFTTKGIPTVTSDAGVQSLTSVSCYLNGSVTSDGGLSVTNRGFCWNISPNPTTSSYTIQQGSGVGSFYATIGTLSANTTYYLRAYAVNSAGTAYSTQISFTTLATVPTLTTNTPTLQSGLIYACGGNISANGGYAVTNRGYVMDLTGNPTITLYTNYDSSGSGNGSYSIQTPPLVPNTTYYCRAFATNAMGTAYGQVISFTTGTTIPTVNTTDTISNITQTTATGGGYVLADGGLSITGRGICWNTSGTPTLSNSKATASGTTGAFSASLSGLTMGTTYYVRAYATNNNGTAYGPQVSFTTTSISLATVTTTTPINSYGSYYAYVYGNVSSDGGGSVTMKGICYNTTGNPTTSNNTVSGGSGTGSISTYLSGLNGSITYHCRAYAINAAGTAYGAEVDFTTSSAATVPTVTTTNPASSIGSTGATVAGNVSSDGGASVTEKGICWNTVGSPTIYDSKVTSGTGTGSISSVLSGLSSGTTYHCRAYATNNQGTAYGAEVDFTTSSGAIAPSVTTGYADAFTSVQRPDYIPSDVNTVNNEVTSDGGSTITERGIVHSWQTSTPTTADSKIVKTGTTGLFSAMITSVYYNDGTVFYFRAYAINAVGTSYGAVRQVTMDASLWNS